MKRVTRRRALSLLAGGAAARGLSPAAAHEEFHIPIRGRRQTLRRMLGGSVGAGPSRKALLASGDGGFHPFGDAIAERLAGWGFDVYQLDSQHYLSCFTGETELTPEQAQEDFRALALDVQAGDGLPLYCMGWSAGAALAALAGAGEGMRPLLAGVVAVALPLEGVLGWRWWDHLQFLPGFRAGGPYFSVEPYVAALAPLPLLALQSDQDRWVTPQDFQAIAAAAREPKKMVWLRAGGHSFPDARPEFFRALREGLDWMGTATPPESR
ncbi:MAG: hypothetical protein GC160_03890 [Acidobacteria bacterium]|nr:hypothetical protein [Acidobacteriota bacterium]